MIRQVDQQDFTLIHDEETGRFESATCGRHRFVSNNDMDDAVMFSGKRERRLDRNGSSTESLPHLGNCPTALWNHDRDVIHRNTSLGRSGCVRRASGYCHYVLRRLFSTALIAFVGLTGCGGGSADLHFDDTVPGDLRELALEAWSDFLAAVPGRRDCIPSPTLAAAWELDNRGEYRPATETIVVRVPGTPATLRSELLHEFAHHVEFTCPEHEDLRTAFLAAQGFPPSVDWFEADTWETTPSEQYAEAIVELVEERRSHRAGIQLTDAAVIVVRDWGLGS